MELDSAVRRVLEGDVSSYEVVVRLCQRELRAFIAYHFPSAHQVDELAQRTFVWAYEHLGDYQSGTRPEAWPRVLAAPF